jgi:hypothetical protein
MGVILSVRDIADAIESQSNEGAAYVNPETREIVQVSEDELALVEETKTFRSGNARRCPRYLRPWKVPAFSPCRIAGNEKLAKYSSSGLEQYRLVETGEGTMIALGLAIAPLGTYVAELAGADLEKPNMSSLCKR